MPKYFIKNTNQKGAGLFATKNIEEKETILQSDLSEIKRVYRKKDFGTGKISKEDEDHLDYVGNGYYVVDYSPISIINHSCNPNSYVKFKTISRKDIIALKPIKKGEEITVDYAIACTDDNWSLKCKCKSKNCRKFIYSNYSKLPQKLQKEFWRLVPEWKRKFLRKTYKSIFTKDN